MRIQWIPLLFSLFFFIIACNHDQTVQITFRVIVPNANDSTEVFITGNHESLGNWHPNAVELVRNKGEKQFSVIRVFPAGVELEYKFTRGNWSTERIEDDGSIPGNFRLKTTKDTTIVCEINRWRDEGIKASGQITGKVEYYPDMSFPGILQRNVIVWLPPNYETEKRQYPVLYMHDGQNVFDPATSYLGFDWQADETADSLIRTGKMEPVIIVGIYNSDERTADYSDTENGRAYQKFIIEKLKPLIDKTYRTKKGPKDTAVMGSSMGGLASFLLAWNHPEIFGKAACLSPAFIEPFEESSVKMVESSSLKPDVQFYMDNGTVGLEAKLQPGCDAMLQALHAKGYTDSVDLLWYQDQSAEHNEPAWANRLWRSFQFLFPVK
ncbi:MAG: histidine kinase [Deferribacteres bacterium]|nr:histidine kinase [candidate division KSB1 bacterium]MCB9502276.1 histidine kinase [Deferribacteres bacterium]